MASGWPAGGGRAASRRNVIQASSVAVSREHRRAKTDRLDVELRDVELLKRALLGWLRGARDHCKMAAIPTLELADARRPSRERETLVGERTRITNRMKSTLARLGIGNFKPNLRKAPERLGALRTPQGVALPAHTMAELQRDMTRLQLVKQQIAEIEQMQLTRLAQPPTDAPRGCPPCDARPAGARHRRRHRDRRHAGQRGVRPHTCRPEGSGASSRSTAVLFSLNIAQ